MPLFGNRTKSPPELVKSLTDNLVALPNLKEKEFKKANDEISKNLQSLKILLCGTAEQEPAPEIVAQIATEMYSLGTIHDMVENLHLVDFESRKDVVSIVNVLFRRSIGTRRPTEEYIFGNQDILLLMLKGYENQEIALNCGMMLRECCRYESLARVLLNAKTFYKFFDYVEVSTFDIASDAFSTFKDLLTRQKLMVAEFLDEHYDKVFSHYQRLLNSENYVTRRQALKLLGELLLDRHNFSTMNRYISNPDNLKLMMNLLREKSRNIQFEAFHVFKIFVANPNKPKPILDILLRNKEKLVEFLTHFHTERSEDEQFNDEKSYLIKQIKDLQPLEVGS